jgi:hypothetical protein
MSENDFLVERNRVFGNSKYIILCSLENSTVNTTDINSVVGSLKTDFKTLIDDQNNIN